MQVADRKLLWALTFTIAVVALEIAFLLFVGPTAILPWQWGAAGWTACFTFFLTVSTGLLWWHTRKLAMDGERQLGITQRAYLAVDPDGVRSVLTPAGNIIGRIVIRNSGHLPARNVRWLINHCFSQDRRLADFPVDRAKLEGCNVVSPGNEMIQGGELFPIETKYGPTGDIYVYVWGIVVYNDGLSEEKRFTRFCHRYNWRNLDGHEIAAHHGRFSRHGNDAT